MNSKSLLTQCILPGCLCLMIASTVNAELVGPNNRGNEYLLFDGLVTIENSTLGTNTLQLISDTSTWQSSNDNTAVDWKTKNIIGDPAWHSAVEVQNTISPADQIIQNTAAKLIWSDGQGTDGSNKAYFRNTFTIPSDYTITAASAKILADDFFAMSVNGHFVTNGLLDTQISKNTANNGLGLPVSVDFANWLKPGENTISIFAYDGYKASTQDLIKDRISVTNQIASDKHSITASFTPSEALFGITISDAADILGYDHFNWYQTIYRKSKDELGNTVITDPTYNGDKFIVDNPNYPPSGYCTTNPCTDPPENYVLKYSGISDNKPFYYNEVDLLNMVSFLASSNLADECLTKNLANTYICQINNSGKTLGFYDAPVGGPLWYAKTVLAGIHETMDKGNIVGRNWDIIYDFNWQASGAAKDAAKVISVDRDLTVYPIVQQCMQGDGANLGVESKICFNNVEEPPIYLLFITSSLIIIFLDLKKPQPVINNTKKTSFL